LPSALSGIGDRRTVAAGTLLFQQESPAESCFYLERGEVALRRLSRSGDEVEIARVGEGEWFGEIILFAESAFPAQAIVVRDSVVLEFRRKAILSVPDPKVLFYFLALLAGKCLKLNRRIEQLTIMDTKERLARFIIGLCPGHASGCEGGRTACSFPLPRKKREIAVELGMAPETLSRTLRQLETEGYIRIVGPRIEIPSCEELRRLVEED
jgi:CRP/FNR family transcriptional regulator